MDFDIERFLKNADNYKTALQNLNLAYDDYIFKPDSVSFRCFLDKYFNAVDTYRNSNLAFVEAFETIVHHHYPKYLSDVKYKTIDLLYPHEIGFTEEGWFCWKIPMLLPKKTDYFNIKQGNNLWLRYMLFTALSNWKKDKILIPFLEKTVVIIRYVYNNKMPKRYYTDFDNYESSLFLDVATLYWIVDDSPEFVDTYYTAGVTEDLSRTELYIVPVYEFFNAYNKIVTDKYADLPLNKYDNKRCKDLPPCTSTFVPTPDVENGLISKNTVVPTTVLSGIEENT